MNGHRYPLVILAILLCSGTTVFAAESSNIRHFPAAGSLQFILHDDINLPFYSWPRTLLTYPVDFADAHTRQNQLQLLNDATGKPVTFQLSNVQETSSGELKFADICFFSDLKPAATVSFRLTVAAQTDEPAQPIVKESRGKGIIEVDGGQLRIRIPQTQQINSGEQTPAPIISINRGSGWIGDNRLLSPKKKVLSITTQSLASGPLFRSYQIRYDFDGGGIYLAIVKLSPAIRSSISRKTFAASAKKMLLFWT